MSKLYAHVMTTPIVEIRAWGIWNVVVAFHRSVGRHRRESFYAEHEETFDGAPGARRRHCGGERLVVARVGDAQKAGR